MGHLAKEILRKNYLNLLEQKCLWCTFCITQRKQPAQPGRISAICHLGFVPEPQHAEGILGHLNSKSTSSRTPLAFQTPPRTELGAKTFSYVQDKTQRYELTSRLHGKQKKLLLCLSKGPIGDAQTTMAFQ